jgi:HPt (histidine-containing phosphotransfer) domain-containing protein
VAHSVRGAAATLGAQGLADAALRLERNLTADGTEGGGAAWLAEGMYAVHVRLSELESALQAAGRFPTGG